MGAQSTVFHQLRSPAAHRSHLPSLLAGALLGGGRGAAQALSTPVALAGVESSQRLRVNQLLNTSGKMGRSAGGKWGETAGGGCGC